MICRRCGRGIMAHESIGGACANRAACDRRKESNVTLGKRFKVGQLVTLDGKERVQIVHISDGGYHVHIAPPGAKYAQAMSESEARKRLLADGEDPKLAQLTIKQRAILDAVRASGGQFLEGADVRNARALARLELVTLEDYGSMRVDLGTRRTDGERWWCKPIGAKP